MKFYSFESSVWFQQEQKIDLVDPMSEKKTNRILCSNYNFAWFSSKHGSHIQFPPGHVMQ